MRRTVTALSYLPDRILFRLARQLDQVNAQIAASYQLRHGLLSVLAALDDQIEPDSQKMIELIEVMIAVQHTLTPEQFAELVEERKRFTATLTPERLAEMVEERERFTAQLSEDDLAEMHRRRLALLPRDGGPEENPKPR